VRFIDERDLWPERRFATTLLVTRGAREHDPSIEALAAALRDEVARANDDPKTTRDEAYAELKRHVGNPGARAVFDDAARFVDFTTDPLRASVETFAASAAAQGLCPVGSVASLFSSSPASRA